MTALEFFAPNKKTGGDETPPVRIKAAANDYLTMRSATGGRNLSV